MANRDVYYIDDGDNAKKMNIDFKWYSGFAKVQKQRSIDSLHEAFENQFPNKKIIEISSASKNNVGVKASAFNLKLKTHHGVYTVEQLFQSGKVYQDKGSMEECLRLPSNEARRLSHSVNRNDKLIGFRLFGTDFPLEPKTFFYDWIYMNAIAQDEKLAKELFEFDAFTDINVKPNYTINSQAKTCSLLVSYLRKHDWKAFKTIVKQDHFTEFKKVFYGFGNEKDEQLTLFNDK